MKSLGLRSASHELKAQGRFFGAGSADTVTMSMSLAFFQLLVSLVV
jgi:hypothetical protein